MENNVGLVHPGCTTERRAYWQKSNPQLMPCGINVKLGFISQDGTKSENMWVYILYVDKDKKEYQGYVNNDPVVLTHVTYGDTVYFSHCEIIETDFKYNLLNYVAPYMK